MFINTDVGYAPETDNKCKSSMSACRRWKQKLSDIKYVKIAGTPFGRSCPGICLNSEIMLEHNKEREDIYAQVSRLQDLLMHRPERTLSAKQISVMNQEKGDEGHCLQYSALNALDEFGKMS